MATKMKGIPEGASVVMIEREWPTLTSRAPKPDGSSPVVIYVYVEDVDQTVERAIAAGAQVLIPAKNQFCGDRAALFYESLPLLGYTGLFFLATHLLVVWYEEPALRRTFGQEYEAYCGRVRRWWPSV